MKRFSVKELRQWIMETATKAIEGDSFQTGTVFYKILPGGVSAVISWSEYGDYQYEKNNPFQRFSKIEICCGQPTECAYNLEIALRITEPVSSWGNLPSDWLGYYGTHICLGQNLKGWRAHFLSHRPILTMV